MVYIHCQARLKHFILTEKRWVDLRSFLGFESADCPAGVVQGCTIWLGLL